MAGWLHDCTWRTMMHIMVRKEETEHWEVTVFLCWLVTITFVPWLWAYTQQQIWPLLSFPFLTVLRSVLKDWLHIISLGTASESCPLCSVFSSLWKVPYQMLPALLHSSPSALSDLEKPFHLHFLIGLPVIDWPTLHINRLKDSERNCTDVL